MIKTIVLLASMLAVAVNGDCTYNISMTNIMVGQPLGHVLLVAHGKDVSLLTVGSPANPGVKEMAERGIVTQAKAAADALLAAKDTNGNFVNSVCSVVQVANPTSPGSTVTFTATILNANERTDCGCGNSNMRFSAFSMLANTNDGFAFLDSRKVPENNGEDNKMSYMLPVMDSGTESNTGNCVDIPGVAPQAVPPCTGNTNGGLNPVPVGEGFIHAHRGLADSGNLQAITNGPGLTGSGNLNFYEWDTYAAKVTVFIQNTNNNNNNNNNGWIWAALMGHGGHYGR